MSRSGLNAAWSEAFFDELARIGITDVCVAPGSRSTPLVLAAARDGRFRMVSIVDERSAGFFALGSGKARGLPAVVITTSGTAAANLYPAVIEAAQGEVPLLVLTADRPHRLRDTDGNQAMDQLRLFGTFPRAFFEVAPPRMDGPSLRHLRSLAARACALAQGPPKGPVHLNFPFEKPLEPELDGASTGGVEALAGGRSESRPFVRVTLGRPETSEEELNRIRELVEGNERGVIVVGPTPDASEVGPAALALGAATGFPVLADPLSGARFGPSQGAHVVGGYDLFLRSKPVRDALCPDLVVRVGGSPTSAGLLDYLGESVGAHQLVVDSGSRWKDHLAAASEYVSGDPALTLRRLATDVRTQRDPRWRALWGQAESRARAALKDLELGGIMEGEVLAAVAETLPDRAALFVASSMPIRDLDAFAFPSPKQLTVYGNRGTSGIDGLVSTTLGIAFGTAGEVGGLALDGSLPAESAEARDDVPTIGVLGDLAFFHDLTGLLVAKSLDHPVVFVVVNNNGGGIFHTLPVREHEPAFSQFFSTPHGLDFEGAAGFFGIPYVRAGSVEELAERLLEALDRGGVRILEIQTQKEMSHALRKGVLTAVAEAMIGFEASGDQPEEQDEQR
jgi:2-succinyl-5-enolpyruvyl-6-hydroxy-3-cyclohexene-1-carboxylate synthase